MAKTRQLKESDSDRINESQESLPNLPTSQYSLILTSVHLRLKQSCCSICITEICIKFLL